jgi:uncharacterized damage-inducible protein DinB
MAFTFEDLIDSLRASRSNFHKHLEGLKEEQWDWKPYPECKSIRETLIHLVVDDRAAADAIEKNGEPDYEGLMNAATAEAEGDIAHLKALADTSFTNLLELLISRYADAPLDTEISVYGSTKKLGVGIPFFSSEDYYHTGQVSFIRMASDPTWNYYAAIYGGAE